MDAPLNELIRGGIPGLVVGLVLSVTIAPFRSLAPTGMPRVDPSLRLIFLFSLVCRASATEYEGPGADRASQLLGRTRRVFALCGSELAARS